MGIIIVYGVQDFVCEIFAPRVQHKNFMTRKHPKSFQYYEAFANAHYYVFRIAGLLLFSRFFFTTPFLLLVWGVLKQCIMFAPHASK